MKNGKSAEYGHLTLTQHPNLPLRIQAVGQAHDGRTFYVTPGADNDGNGITVTAKGVRIHHYRDIVVDKDGIAFAVDPNDEYDTYRLGHCEVRMDA